MLKLILKSSKENAAPHSLVIQLSEMTVQIREVLVSSGFHGIEKMDQGQKSKTETFNDLLRIQKTEIVDSMLETVKNGGNFTWSSRLHRVSVQLHQNNLAEPVAHSLIRTEINKALRIFNRAPIGYQLSQFLTYEQENAA